jgi:hypothetical protein
VAKKKKGKTEKKMAGTGAQPVEAMHAATLEVAGPG